MPSIEQITDRFSEHLIATCQVRCSACCYAVSFRVFDETVECVYFDALKNAEAIRVCTVFESKP